MKDSIKAIFFDIDDTLFSTSLFAEKARKRAIDTMIQLGWKVDPEEAYQELSEVISEFSPNYGGHFDKLVLRMGAKAYESLNPAILIAQAVVSYHESKHKFLYPYPDVLPLFRVLAKKNLELGIITDGLTIKQAEKVIRLGIYSYLNPHCILISEQLGISKPNKKLFQQACNRCNLKASEIMYIGDNPKNDIVPAKEVGMVTVRILRDGKYRHHVSPVTPDYEISGFESLQEILRKDLGWSDSSFPQD